MEKNENKNNFQKLFYDEFDIDGQYQKLRKLMSIFEKDVYQFISPTKNKKASVRAKTTLRKIRKVAVELGRSINKQRDHNGNEY